MKTRSHFRIFIIATAVWALFWVAGLPSYYLQYSRGTMVAVSALLIPLISALSYVVLRPVRPSRRMSHATWLAFYFSVPLAFYDWLYCGIYRDYGVRFLEVFWYLTLFYFVPWLALPAVAIVLNRTDHTGRLTTG